MNRMLRLLTLVRDSGGPSRWANRSFEGCLLLQRRLESLSYGLPIRQTRGFLLISDLELCYSGLHAGKRGASKDRTIGYPIFLSPLICSKESRSCAKLVTRRWVFLEHINVPPLS